MGFPGGSVVKNLPAMQETWVQSLDWEDPLKEGMATQSSILAWRIPWTEMPGQLQSIGLQRVGHDSVTNTFFIFKYVFIESNFFWSNSKENLVIHIKLVTFQTYKHRLLL